MIKVRIQFWPRVEEVTKDFNIMDLNIHDFLDWVTEDDNKQHMYNASQNQELVYESKSPLVAEMKRCDDFYKELFLLYMKPIRYRFRVKRLAVADYRYYFSCEFLTFDDFSKNYFDFSVATNFEKLEYEVMDEHKIPIRNEMMF